jgi:hypothetical protein
VIAILVCILAFGLSLWASRRSLVAGLVVVLGTGYFYGIVRANIISPYSHFIFDASLAGLYLAQLHRNLTRDEQRRSSLLRGWMLVLIAWPALVCLMPFQTPLVSLVGLRGNIFFLPLCLFPVRMKSRDWMVLSLALAALNVMALSFGAGEYALGVEKFYPVSPVTAIIYASHDVAGYQYFRIPAIFVNAHSYAGTMVATMPFLVGAWTQPGLTLVRRYLLAAGLVSAILGVLMANARVHVVAAAIVVIAAVVQGKISRAKRLIFCAGIAAAAVLAFSNERLQRFTSLSDTEGVTGRIQGSVNRTFLEVLIEYPMGNGLGGGGTSLPNFLEGQVVKPVAIESEYGRILLEQGIIGLLFWSGFICWFLTSSHSSAPSTWVVARRLTWCWCAVSFAISMIGTGMLTAIPSTALMILGIGWVTVRPVHDSDAPVSRPAVAEYEPAWA